MANFKSIEMVFTSNTKCNMNVLVIGYLGGLLYTIFNDSHDQHSFYVLILFFGFNYGYLIQFLA